MRDLLLSAAAIKTSTWWLEAQKNAGPFTDACLRDLQTKDESFKIGSALIVSAWHADPAECVLDTQISLHLRLGRA